MLDIKSTCKFETADIFTSLLLQKVLLQQSDTETYCPNLSEKGMKWYEGSAIKGLWRNNLSLWANQWGLQIEWNESHL